MDGLIITGDSYGPSPVSGGAPSPPLMIEGPRRPPSAPVGRRIDPYGESQRITSLSLIFTAVGHHPSAATWCPSLSPLTHLTSFFSFSPFTFLSSSFYFFPVCLTSSWFLSSTPVFLLLCLSVESFRNVCNMEALFLCCFSNLLHLFVL